MRVRLTKPLGRHAEGSEHDVSEFTAARLIRKGAAEKVGAKKPKRIRAQLEPRTSTLPPGMTTVRNTTGEDEPLVDPV